MKRNPTKTLKKKLDKLWSLIIRKKYPKCIVCGQSPTQAHHAICRKSKGLYARWCLDNSVGLCVKCHLFRLHGQQGDKEFLDDYLCKLNRIIHPAIQADIKFKSNMVVKYSIQELEEKVKEFEELLNG